MRLLVRRVKARDTAASAFVVQWPSVIVVVTAPMSSAAACGVVAAAAAPSAAAAAHPSSARSSSAVPPPPPRFASSSVEREADAQGGPHSSSMLGRDVSAAAIATATGLAAHLSQEERSWKMWAPPARRTIVRTWRLPAPLRQRAERTARRHDQPGPGRTAAPSTEFFEILLTGLATLPPSAIGVWDGHWAERCIANTA